MAFDAKWRGIVKRRIIGNIMIILGSIILMFFLFNPFDNLDNNTTLNVGSWFLFLGLLIKIIGKSNKENKD
jgi:hypothetical protein